MAISNPLSILVNLALWSLKFDPLERAFNVESLHAPNDPIKVSSGFSIWISFEPVWDVMCTPFPYITPVTFKGLTLPCENLRTFLKSIF